MYASFSIDCTQQTVCITHPDVVWYAYFSVDCTHQTKGVSNRLRQLDRHDTSAARYALAQTWHIVSTSVLTAHSGSV